MRKMRKIKFGILIILMAIGGVALFQVGNVCTAEDIIPDTNTENVVLDMTIQVPAHGYRAVYTIQRPSHESYSRGYRPVYKISVKAWNPNEDRNTPDRYKPIDLLISDEKISGNLLREEVGEGHGVQGMINGTYYFSPPCRETAPFPYNRMIVPKPPYHVILINRSGYPLCAHIRIIEMNK